MRKLTIADANIMVLGLQDEIKADIGRAVEETMLNEPA